MEIVDLEGDAAARLKKRWNKKKMNIAGVLQCKSFVHSRTSNGKTSTL